MRIAIVVYEGVDLLDAGGPYEVFLTASRLATREGSPAPFDTFTAGSGDVVAYGGLGLRPQQSLESDLDSDVLVVPGAIDIDRACEDKVLIKSLQKAAAQVDVVASVCTGAFLLSEMGLLPKSWTTHWEDIDALQRKAGGEGERTAQWTDSGRIVTSGGLTSGIAMALHLVDRFAGRELAERTSVQIEYAWDPSGGGRVPVIVP